MLLPQQIQAILYHFMMGWVYGACFSFLSYMLRYVRHTMTKAIVEVMFHTTFTVLLFYGLYKINGGISSIYFVLLFVIGICIYYKWYLTIILNLASTCITILKPIQHKIRVVKSHILAIINIRQKAKKRRAKHGKEKRKKHKQE